MVLRLFVMVGLFATTLVGFPRPVSAQGTPQPNVIVSLNNAQAGMLASFAPGNAQPTKLADVPVDRILALSPDNKFLAIYGYDASTETQVLSVGPVGGAQSPVALEKGLDIFEPTFSADSRYLSFTTANIQDGKADWALNFLEIATGAKVSVTGVFTLVPEDAKDNVFYGIAHIVGGWDAANKNFLAHTFIPYTEGNTIGIVRFDLSGIDLTKPGAFPLPQPTEVAKIGKGSGDQMFSPDGTKFAYIHAVDPAPPGFQASGQGSSPFNALRIIDIAKNETKDIPVAAESGVGYHSWSADGTKLYYIGGKYDTTDYVVTPRLYTYDLASGSVSEGPVLEPGADQTVGPIQVCGDTLFYAAAKRTVEAAPPEVKLFSAPLADAANRTQLAAASSIFIYQCGA